ncbi:hypothetical protein GPJ56_007169 [Histomonas meleagridis]|uniref:uncharacterized protein n=1 Tax=Histomonas meleagridis TaxID=135588 RepID=UPI00355958A2|nr:hypothetical protein GPJ56_007169 [Histomonas meleagridis]KAH0806167.1 hypothetical protein GO595_000855 [Histomonas meleagridis]
MTNRICIIPHGDPKAAQEVAMTLSPEGKPIEIKNKYFEASLKLDFDVGGKPPAVLWISDSHYCDKNIPPSGQYKDAELRLLLRIIDESSNDEIPQPLQDWELDNFAEIVNVKLSTLAAEFRKFHEGNGRSSLLDTQAPPAGCRILEALEMVNWPIKTSAGKPLIEKKIERLVALMKNTDPENDSFDQAMSLMMELKSEIPNLPDDQRHKYAAQVAMAFQSMLEFEEEEEEQFEPKHEYTAIKSDDGEE